MSSMQVRSTPKNAENTEQIYNFIVTILPIKGVGSRNPKNGPVSKMHDFFTRMSYRHALFEIMSFFLFA